MKRFSFQQFASDENGAIAATYAIALTALVAVGGVAFDYSRMATMDSELQNAADQAALAAATQLDGTPNAINRAVAQASGLVTNQAVLANDGDAAGTIVTINTVTFYNTRADAEAGANPITDNAQSARAHFVRVVVNPRKAFYAFTPIVGAVSSGDMAAAATAGMGSSICKVPPLMMCNPGNDAASVDVAGLVGKGLRLKASGGGAAYAPGDFGFLETSLGSGANALAQALAYATPPGECVEVTNPETRPGSVMSVIDDFNTRFDIFNGGDNIGCYGSSLCPPSDNSRKDVVQRINGGGGPGGGGSSGGNGNGNGNGNGGGGGGLSQADCGYASGAGGNGWRLTPNPYRPLTATTYAAHIAAGTKTGYPDVMGYPRDLCHAWSDAGNCAGGLDGRIGNGDWDIDAYWRVNYGAAYAGQVPTSVAGRSYPTRYEVYKWERANNPTPNPRNFNSGGDNYRDYRTAICRPSASPGVTSPDRRILPVAIVDCTGLNGKAQVTPLDWIDVFLAEPSLDRDFGSTRYTNKGDIYIEVIGRTSQGSGGSANQYVRRDKPFLVN